MQFADLLQLWEQILAGETPGWPAGRAFEYVVLRAFEIEGAEVRWPYPVHFGEVDEVIEQIDGVVYAAGMSALVESKDYREKLNVEPIAKLRNQLLRRPAATIGVVFSSGEFTEPAITLARFLAPQTILLWTGKEFDYAIHRSAMTASLQMKYRNAVEEGMPDFDIRVQE